MPDPEDFADDLGRVPLRPWSLVPGPLKEETKDEGQWTKDDWPRFLRRYIADRGADFGEHRYLFRGQDRGGGMFVWIGRPTFAAAVAAFRQEWLGEEGK